MAAAVIAVLCALQLPDAAAAGADPHLLGKRVNSLATVLGPDQGGLVAGARARV